MPQIIANPTWDEIEQLMSDVPDLVAGFYGPRGVGKTSFAWELAEQMDKPYLGKVQFHDDLSPAEIMGMAFPSKSGYKWEDGPGSLAYANGGILLLDEINAASGPCKTYMYSLLDRGPGGTISYVGRTFEQEEGYLPIATMNGDPNSGELPEAVLDRFDVWFLITRPSDRLLAMITDERLRQHCVSSYTESEEKNALIGPAFTFRNYMSLQKIWGYWPLDKALLTICRGDQILANSMYETLKILEEPDDEEEEESA